MSKVVIQNKRGKITITNRLSYPETVNERVNHAIASGMFEGVLPVTIKQKRKETRIECTIQGLLTLNQYFDGLVSKKTFLDFVYQIAGIIKNCEKNMVSASNLDLQKDRVFFDPLTKSVKCVYWPVVNNQRSESAHLFLKQIPYDIRFNSHEDDSFLEQYAAFFNGHTPFSINSFERLILKLQGKEVLSGGHTYSGSLLRNSNDEKKSSDVSQSKNNVEYDPVANAVETSLEGRGVNSARQSIVFCSACGAENKADANFCSMCGKKMGTLGTKQPKASHTVDSEAMVLEDDSGGTVVLEYDAVEDHIYPFLIRLKTNQKVAVNKPVFRIGSKQTDCDFFISDNHFISRSHANIVSKDNRYFIVDKNSRNKTFINGKAIPQETEVEIFAGTLIRLANEDFMFSFK